MALREVKIYWAGAVDANSSTEYQVLADKGSPGVFDLVTTQAATLRASQYTPITTTLAVALNADLTDTTVELADATNIVAGDKIVVDKEPIILGTKSGNIFTGCTRALGAAIRGSHAIGAPIVLLHESFTENVEFSTRKLIRYQVKRKQGTNLSIPAEFPQVNFTQPRSTDFTMLHGWLLTVEGDPVTGQAVKLYIDDVDNYLTGTGALLFKQSETTTTNNEGYWEIQIPRNISRAGGDPIKVEIQHEGKLMTWVVDVVPDVDGLNLLET